MLVAIEADLVRPEGIALRRARATLAARSGLGFGHSIVAASGLPERKRVLDGLMRENTSALAPSAAAAAWRQIPSDGEIITHAPNLMWGTDGVRVFTVDDGWGWFLDAPSSMVRTPECVGWHRWTPASAASIISKFRRPAGRLSPCGLAAGCMARHRRPALLGGWPGADGSRALAVSVGPLHQPDQVLGARSSRPTPSSPSPLTNGVAERFNRTLKEQCHPWSHLPHDIAARLRDAVRDFVEFLYNATSGSPKTERLSPGPAQARPAWHAGRDLNQARTRVTTNLMRQGTGCATLGVTEAINWPGPRFRCRSKPQGIRRIAAALHLRFSGRVAGSEAGRFFFAR